MLKLFFGIFIFVMPTLLLAQADGPVLSDDTTEAPRSEGNSGESAAPNESIEKNANDLPTKGAQSDQANPQDAFQDPFANPVPEVNDPATPPTTHPDDIAPARPNIPSEAPPSTPPARAEPVRPVETPSAPPPVPQNIDTPKTFDFPESDEVKGPVSAEYASARRQENETKSKTFNAGLSFGGGFNMNRRYNQPHLEISGGYRLTEVWEVGLSGYYRLVKDSLMGLLATVKYGFVVLNRRDLRIDVLPQFSMGWTLRKAPSGTKFSEGRMPIRIGAETVFYPFPKFGITVLTAVEMFLFSLTTDGTTTNFLSKGVPTQAIIGLGTRWEF
jgi:hypothetical protein